MIELTVIIPTRNRRELLLEALGSLLSVEDPAKEVIVVDDGSTDGTTEAVLAYGSPVRLLSQPNKGPGAARNAGAQSASGEYLAFLDSDDLWFPWTIGVYEQIIAKTGAAFIAGRPFRFRKSEELERVSREQAQWEVFPDYLASGDTWRWWGCSSFVIKRETFLEVKGFADVWINGEDADLAMRLGGHGAFVQVTSPVTFGYREHQVSEMKKSDRTVAGALHMLMEEQRGRYPGSNARARERWQIITRHIRPVALDCLANGRKREAWQLYRGMLRWHLSLGRWKFLVGFLTRAIVVTKP